MKVLAIEIHLNGKLLAVAGAKNLALLSAHIGAGVGPEKRSLHVEDAFQLTAMGLTSFVPGSRMANLTWINGQVLKVGDSVTFRIVQVEQADPPAQILRTPTSQELAAAAEKERLGLAARPKAVRRRRI